MCAYADGTSTRMRRTGYSLPLDKLIFFFWGGESCAGVSQMEKKRLK